MGRLCETSRGAFEDVRVEAPESSSKKTESRVRVSDSNSAISLSTGNLRIDTEDRGGDLVQSQPPNPCPQESLTLGYVSTDARRASEARAKRVSADWMRSPSNRDDHAVGGRGVAFAQD